jgi:hypothetical protein
MNKKSAFTAVAKFYQSRGFIKAFSGINVQIAARNLLERLI